jgi:glycosyltransferase involved in cell wall biosynthesis
MAIEPLRLLIFAHALQGRGTERALVRLLKELDPAKVQPLLVVVSARGEFRDAVPDNIEIHDLQMGQRRTSTALFALESYVRRLRPHLAMSVHISAGRVLCALRLRHPSLRVLCMEADPFMRIESEKGHIHVRKVVSRFTYRLATHVVAASDVVANDLMKHLQVPSRKITTIPLPSVDDDINALSQEWPSDPPFSPPGSNKVIVTIGNMFEHKDQETLIRAFRTVNAELPSHLVLIGDGPRRTALEDLSAQLGLADRVWFLGFQRNPFKFLSHSSVFVSASIAEGFEISQIEAMACGLPVIVTDAPRFKAVEDGRTGLLVPPSQPEIMAKAILRVLQSQELAAELGQNAKEAAQAYTSAKIARRYERLFMEIVDRH